jgi:hypothetical protein
MALSSSSGFVQWAYGIDRFRHGRHGKMDIRRGSSVQSDGIVSTMSLCSANDIFAICSIRTKNITTRLGRTYRCTRTRRSHVASRLSVARWRSQFWAGRITNISGRKFLTRTAMKRSNKQATLRRGSTASCTCRRSASCLYDRRSKS